MVIDGFQEAFLKVLSISDENCKKYFYWEVKVNSFVQHEQISN